ncbi:MAG: PEGA domain-containing protein [Melioribacteraceae bacterium]|nr:PEGA domain-containing protein [Melioribacteraceae bacterium]
MKKNILFILLIIIAIISCEKEVFVENEIKESFSYGKLLVECLPGKSLVFLNGKNTGFQTGDTIKFIEPGNYKLTLKQNLFNDTTLNVVIKPDLLTKEFVNFYLDPNNFGKIYCDANKQFATIYLNDNKTNLYTPALITRLFPGDHKIKISLVNHRSDSAKVKVEAGKTSYLYFNLEDTSKWVSYTISNSPLTSNHLSSIVVDKNNVKWIGTRDQGLFSFDDKKWNIYQKSNSQLIYDFINYLSVDDQNNLWIATTGGLMRKNGNQWIDYSSNLPSTYVTSIAHDKNGITWIGTSNGLVKFNGSSWIVFNTSNSTIPSNFITTVAVDNSNNIWIGTSSNGVGYFNGSTWQNYNMNNMKLPVNVGNSIKYVKVDINGIVWVAHVQNLIAGEQGGLTSFDGTSWKQVSLVGLPTQQVEYIYIDSNKNKWIATKNGFGYFLNDFSVKVFNTTNSPLTASQVVGLVIDKNFDLFVATYGGGMCKVKRYNYY